LVNDELLFWNPAREELPTERTESENELRGNEAALGWKRP
jgi:hypothetical protein